MKTEGLYNALEINHERSGDTHCLDDSKEGIMAFLEKAKAKFQEVDLGLSDPTKIE
ncbi:hypothetical protein [Desulfocastanea catecholica]